VDGKGINVRTERSNLVHQASYADLGEGRRVELGFRLRVLDVGLVDGDAYGVPG
jgi:hypothetical protein